MGKHIVVTGATGKQGGSVIRWLRRKSDDYRFTYLGVGRDADSPESRGLATLGIELRECDLSSYDQVVSVFQGAWGVFAVTNFCEHDFVGEQLHARNIIDAAKACGVKHIVWSSLEGRRGECEAPAWKSKAMIEDVIKNSGISWTFVYCPLYYETFFTGKWGPKWDRWKGFQWNVPFPPDVPIFMFSVEDLGAWVAEVFRDPEAFSSKRLKLVADYVTLRRLVKDFSDITGEKACLTREYTQEQFEKTCEAHDTGSEAVYQMFKFIQRAGPDSGVRDYYESVQIYPNAQSYQYWVANSRTVREVRARGRPIKDGTRSEIYR
ncbi:hypothetical protein AX16_003939 [Volvariella volvacea WC 439]|nr:hypothetical protein AX16_003939 [Volvariella volvacea WC 439]